VTRLYVLVLALIVYGSLYPFQFVTAAKPFREMAGSMKSSIYLRDALVNVAFYLPVGASGYLAFRRSRSRTASFAAAVVIGTVLSLFVELVQGAYAPRRVANIYDIGANFLGAVLGAGIAALYSRVDRKLDNDPAALALLVAWLAHLWFPLSMLIVPFRLADAEWTAIGLISTAAVWYVVGHAIDEAGFRPANAWLLVSLFAIVPRLAVLPREIVLADIAAAAAGAAAFLIKRVRFGPALLLLLLLRGLAPFRFTDATTAIAWIPFSGLLEESWQHSTMILADKLFFYGAAVWTLRREGAKARTAAIATAAVLSVVEFTQQWLARTPEITDPLLALMIGVGLDAFERRPRRTSSPS
jgi:glycopeptide antibiotics resistance protein